MKRFLVFLIHVGLLGSATGAEQQLRTSQQGVMTSKENQVEYFPHGTSSIIAPTNQLLSFDDALRTLELSRATVRLTDWTQLYLKDQSRLEIIRQSGVTNSPGLMLRNGQLYVSSRGGAQGIPVKTPEVYGVPKGTEFLVQVEGGVTEFTMLEGEVALSNEANPEPVVVRKNQQAVARPGEPIRIRPLIARETLVQWWLYYPAILDLEEMPFAPEERAKLGMSLEAYRSGHLRQALECYPGYPSLPTPGSESERLFQAGLLLAVGSVDRSQTLLAPMGDTPTAEALRLLIRVVTEPSSSNRCLQVSGPKPSELSETNSASYLLALSYAHQRTNALELALGAAQRACHVAPRFGFAWARVAELQFSFGRTRKAKEAVERALEASPENPQARAVRGFLLASEYRMTEAIAEFDRAIEIDPALGNAWLGRGLCKRRQGILAPRPYRDADSGRVGSWLSDLQTAAAVEPGRSLVRAYAGKAFSEVGDERLALKELSYAAQLDPGDPTPPLFRALELQRQNRPNEAVRELQHSMELNDNRAIYRPRLLLDQDQAVRGASLAKIYQDAGLLEVAVREAARAVSYDYSSHAAHQFLAESYNAMRDPARFNLRYETVWFNELLLANIMSPVGSGLLSQNISQQEYSRLFDANRIGLTTSSECRSDGQFREVVSQYGIAGKSAYTLDLDYQHNQGTRPNNDLSRIEWYSQFKHQLNDRDSAFLLTEYTDYQSGDNYQHYDPSRGSVLSRLTEDHSPQLAAALQRVWSPESRTILLASWMNAEQTSTGDFQVYRLRTNAGTVFRVLPSTFPEGSQQISLGIGSLELNHNLQAANGNVISGARFQLGDIDATSKLSVLNSNLFSVFGPKVVSDSFERDRRISIYSYGFWELRPGLTLMAGGAYDDLSYPSNFRFAPVTHGLDHSHSLSPKGGIAWDAKSRMTIRGLYTESIGAVAVDDAFRLEPAQLLGFPQAFRSLISESEVGSVSAPSHRIADLSVDFRLPHSIYANISAQRMEASIDQSIGVFFGGNSLATSPGATSERLRYVEQSVAVSLQSLLGELSSVRLGYVVRACDLDRHYPAIPTSLPLYPGSSEQTVLQELNLGLRFNHPSGFFADSEIRGYFQHNSGFSNPTRSAEHTYQSDVRIGWRLFRRRLEASLSCLNFTDQDYRLSSLTPYPSMPRERVWVGTVRLTF